MGGFPMIRQVLSVWRRTDGEERIPILKIELDYELMVLYDALQDNDQDAIKESKQRLEILRQEMIRLEA